jgi:hypothetical protein
VDGILLAYFPCFEIIKANLFVHAVCPPLLTLERLSQSFRDLLGMYIGILHKPLHQLVCLYVYPLSFLGSDSIKNVTAATNTHARIE